MLTRLILLLSVTLFGFGALVAMPEIAFAGSAKVLVCHIPPGNPENFHTIKISQNALDAHLGHGDLAGACSALCAALCDDGDACTIDDTADCEEVGCPVDRAPVVCDDGLLCTSDTCDPVSGCNYQPVVCDDGDACTVDTCDSNTGQCTAPPVECDAGGECNPDDGECIPPDASGDNLIWTSASGQEGLTTSFWVNETGSDVGEGIVLVTREDSTYFTIGVTCVRFNYPENEVNLGGYITASSVPAEVGDPVIGWAWDNPNGADGIGFWRDPNVSNPPCSNASLEWTGGGTVTTGEVIITQ